MQTQLNRKQLPTKRRRIKRIFKWVLATVLVFTIGLAGAAWWQFNNVLDKVTGETVPEPGNNMEITKSYNHKPVSIVILGKDSRGNIGLLNTDVMIVAVLNPETKRATMMAIPRDTGVQVPGYKGWYKINSVYARGEEERIEAEQKGKTVVETGISLVKKTLEGAIGIPVQHYVTLDFEGFEQVVDKLGGIQVSVDKSMKYDDPADGTHIDLQPGEQVLNGEQALGFVRHRKDNRGPKYYSTDFDRGNRQQTVIKAVVDKMKSFSGYSNLFGVMEVAADHIHTDLSKDQIKGMILDFKSIGSENITSIKTGGYWDAVSTHTIIPKENVVKIQQSFRQEMELGSSRVSSTFRENPEKQVPVRKKNLGSPSAASKEQEEEALKIQLEEKKNEQVNLEKAQPVRPTEKLTQESRPPSVPINTKQKVAPLQESPPAATIPVVQQPNEAHPTGTSKNGEKPMDQPNALQPPMIVPNPPTKPSVTGDK
jgi:polyisoprenyl-teichoic acid--peptidoglycan teichoic acid transferase